MDASFAVEAFQALGHDHRLRLFRLLVRWMPDGLSAGQIAEAIGVAPSALSFHLGSLQGAGLVRAARRGRQVFYVVDPAAVSGLTRYFTQECCGDRPELCGLAGDRKGGGPMADKIFNVLFLCTGNSARSIIAEAILAREGRGRFNAYSAGSHPKGQIHPYAFELLRNLNHDVSRFRSKSWDEFAVPGAPEMNFVFTVCDNAASEVCPVWPGQPMTAHWGLPDPAAAEGTEAVKRAAFADAYRMLNNRISLLINLPLASLDRLQLQRRLDDIGKARSERQLG